MIKGKLAKKIMTISIAAAMLSSFAISAIAEEPLSDTLEGEPETETSEVEAPATIDWDSYMSAADSLYDKLTSDEKDECQSFAAKYNSVSSALESAGYSDCAKAIRERAYFVKMEELVKKNHSKDAIIKNIYTAVRQMYQDIIQKIGNETDYDVLDELMDMIDSLGDFNDAVMKASGGALTEEEFDAFLNAYNKYLEFSDNYKKAFEQEGATILGVMKQDVESSVDVKTDVKLFTKEHKVLAKSVDEVELDDSEAVQTALDEFEGLSSPSKFALSEQKETLDTLKAKIDALQAEADAKAAEEEAARKAAEEEAARKAAEEAAKTVSDSDVQTPDDGATSGGKEDTKPVSDSDATSGDAATTDDKDKDKDKDKGKDKDSVTDIETGEADYLLPSLISMASSALGYAGMLFKRKKSM